MKVLVLGAGGIGCEILKILVGLECITHVDLVDMDTVGATNLHRQFLFSEADIGKPKAAVAAARAVSFLGAPMGKILPMIVDLFSLPLETFEKADIVINALDNIEARSRASLMSLLAKKLLIDAGTAGMEGQVSLLCGAGRQLECFDCGAPNQLSAGAPIPVCTIRQTPSTFTHCVIWAREAFFAPLFQMAELEDDQEEGKEPGGKKSKIAAADWEQSEFPEHEPLDVFLKDFVRQKIAPSQGNNSITKLDDWLDVLTRVFHTEIKRLCAIESLWVEGRTPPHPLPANLIQKQYNNGASYGEYCEEFELPMLIMALLSNAAKLTQRALPISSIDKDDDEVVAFIHAAAAIRASLFGITAASIFHTRAIIGRIVPAVVSTNAIAAGMALLHFLHLYWIDDMFRFGSGGAPHISAVYFTPWGKNATGPFLIERTSMNNRRANPTCVTCGNGMIVASVNVISTKLRELLDLLKGVNPPPLPLGDDEFSVFTGKGKMIFDPEFVGLLDFFLSDLGIMVFVTR